MDNVSLKMKIAHLQEIIKSSVSEQAMHTEEQEVLIS